ncbi:MAG: hypothetical protein ACPGOY_11800 [Rhodospirillaceae bacterium]
MPVTMGPEQLILNIIYGVIIVGLIIIVWSAWRNREKRLRSLKNLQQRMSAARRKAGAGQAKAGAKGAATARTATKPPAKAAKP